MRGRIIIALLALSCAHGDEPKKGHAAKQMDCKRSDVELSETFEHTWTGEDGTMRLRYQVSASCHLGTKKASDARLDYWRDCKWGDKDWDCEDWKSGTAPPAPGKSKDWIDRSNRGR